MRLHVDQEADARYLRLDDSKIMESEEVALGVVLDFNEHNQVVGIEMPLGHWEYGEPGLQSALAQA